MLYQKNSLKDNHVQHDFLSQLQINKNISFYSYDSFVFKALKVSDQVNCCLIFVCIFVDLYTHSHGFHLVKAFQIIIPFFYLSFLFFRLIYKNYSLFLFFRVKSLLVFVFFLSIFSAVIRTLTDDVSSNVLWVLVGFCLSVSVFTYSYNKKASFKNSLVSFNTRFISACLLSSRFKTDLDVFFLMNTVAFFLFPFHFFCQKVYQKKKMTLFFSVLMNASANIILFFFSPKLSFFHFVSQCFSFFFCPYLLYSFQKHKKIINGPWDEAVPG